MTSRFEYKKRMTSRFDIKILNKQQVRGERRVDFSNIMSSSSQRRPLYNLEMNPPSRGQIAGAPLRFGGGGEHCEHFKQIKCIVLPKPSVFGAEQLRRSQRKRSEEVELRPRGRIMQEQELRGRRVDQVKAGREVRRKKNYYPQHEECGADRFLDGPLYKIAPLPPRPRPLSRSLRRREEEPSFLSGKARGTVVEGRLDRRRELLDTSFARETGLQPALSRPWGSWRGKGGVELLDPSGPLAEGLQEKDHVFPPHETSKKNLDAARNLEPPKSSGRWHGLREQQEKELERGEKKLERVKANPSGAAGTGPSLPVGKASELPSIMVGTVVHGKEKEREVVDEKKPSSEVEEVG